MPIEMIRTEIRPSTNIPYYVPSAEVCGLVELYINSGKVLSINDFVSFEQDTEIKTYKMTTSTEAALDFILNDPRWKKCMADMNKYADENGIIYTETQAIT